MPLWSNWSGKQTARPQVLHFVRSEADARALVADVAARGATLRASGAGHSHAPLVVNDGVIADLSGLSGVIETDRQRCSAWLWAGTPIYALGRALHDAGLALANQGDIDRQTIGGAVATGTHGTGVALGNLSSKVRAVRLVLASGELVTASPEQHPELFAIARLHLGAVGLVTALELQLRPAYRLRERTRREAFEGLFPHLDDLVGASRHFEFFWYPHDDQAQVKVIDETADAAEYPLAAEGSRCAYSYEVLPNHRPHRHTEMEYAVPAENGAACLAAIRALIRDRFVGMRWPVEYRSVAADDVWLSAANGRATVTISVHEDVANDETEYFQACEAIFLAHGGRPHWGKLNYLDGSVLARIHPDWHRWWRARDVVDPAGVFLNPYLRGIRPGAI